MSSADAVLEMRGCGEDPTVAANRSRSGRDAEAALVGHRWVWEPADERRHHDPVPPHLRERARRADALEREVDDLRGLIACLSRDKVRLEEHLRAAQAELDEMYRRQATLERQLAERGEGGA